MSWSRGRYIVHVYCRMSCSVVLDEMGGLEMEEEVEEKGAEGLVLPERDDAAYCFTRHEGSSPLL